MSKKETRPVAIEIEVWKRFRIFCKEHRLIMCGVATDLIEEWLKQVEE